MKASIFESRKKKSVEKRIPLSIPVELYEEIEKVKERLKKSAPDMRFNVNALCVETLTRAVKKANKELDELGEV